VAAVDLASCAPDAMEPENCRRTKLVWSAPARRFVPGHPPAAKAR
jgi:hypothetical protein